MILLSFDDSCPISHKINFSMLASERCESSLIKDTATLDFSSHFRGVCSEVHPALLSAAISLRSPEITRPRCGGANFAPSVTNSTRSLTMKGLLCVLTLLGLAHSLWADFSPDCMSTRAKRSTCILEECPSTGFSNNLICCPKSCGGSHCIDNPKLTGK